MERHVCVIVVFPTCRWGLVATCPDDRHVEWCVFTSRKNSAGQIEHEAAAHVERTSERVFRWSCESEYTFAEDEIEGFVLIVADEIRRVDKAPVGPLASDGRVIAHDSLP